jgi:hypothetical protein
MRISKTFIRLSILAGLLMAVVSFLGIADPGTYAKETENWAGQAIGQDLVNLAVVLPVLLIASFLVLRRDSFRAFLVWMGALIYLIYSYILYSFFLHFGPLFLLYVATLGLSFYSLVGAFSRLDWQNSGKSFANVHTRPASFLLGIVAVLFALLWLTDIVGALLRGGVPADLDKVGLLVNPIQVLDLAFLLPGAFIVAVLLSRRRTIGFVLAAPLLVFFILMGIAIISMMVVTAQKGFALALPQMVVMGVIITASSVIAIQYLNRTH